MTRTLNFNVNAQIVEAIGDFSNLVPGTAGYLIAKFDFSDEWKGCVKIASFWDRKIEYAVRLNNNSCEIPAEVCAKKEFKVQVTGARGGYKITTNKLKVRQEV